MRRHPARRPQRFASLAAGATALLLVTLVLVACAGAPAGGLTRTSDGGDVPNVEQPLPPTDVAVEGGAGGGTIGIAESAPLPVEQAADAAATGPMIVRTGTMDLQVGDVDRAIADATAAVTAAGGYVAGSQRSLDGDRPFASITFRIPATAWDATLAKLRALGTKVLGERTSADEVTAQVVDLDARLKNLRATETQLLGVMQEAVKIPDILAVQAELTNVQGQIEQLQAQRDHLADQAAQGTLTTSFALAPAPVEAVTSTWDPATVVADATAALVGLGQSIASAAIWLAIVGLPILLAGLLVLVPLLLVVRRLARRGPRAASPTDVSGPTVEPTPAA
jgi:hypothetical protein